MQVDVPRERAGTFEPQIVRKRQRRLTGVDEMVPSLYARGLTTGPHEDGGTMWRAHRNPRLVGLAQVLVIHPSEPAEWRYPAVTAEHRKQQVRAPTRALLYALPSWS